MRGALLGLTCAQLSACGRINFDAVSSADATTVDAFPTGPFGSLMPLTSLNSIGADVDPSLTADGLQLFFVSNRTGNFEVYSSVRGTVADPWPAPARVDPGTISTLALEQDAVISADGLTLYFTRSGDIYRATRATPTASFGTATPIAELNSSDQDTMSSITADELTLTFHSTRPGGQGVDIYVASRSDRSAAWDPPALIPGAINGPNTESDSFMLADRLTVYFDTNRPSGGTDYNIHIAHRASATDPFGSPTPVAELNSSETDGDTWISNDGHLVLFARGPFATLDIWEARR